MARLHGRPLGRHHRPAVARQLAVQQRLRRLREGVGVVVERGDRGGLLLGRCARRVVALEGQQKHEGKQHRVGRPGDREHARGLLGVAEVAALRRLAPQQQHRGHRDGVREDEHEDRDGRAHARRDHIPVRDRPGPRVTRRGMSITLYPTRVPGAVRPGARPGLPERLRGGRDRSPARARHRRARRLLRAARGARHRRHRRLRPGAPGAGRVHDRRPQPPHDRRAAAVPQRGGPLPAAHARGGDRARQAHRARRPRRQGAHDQLQPAPRRLDRAQVPGRRRPVACST